MPAEPDIEINGPWTHRDVTANGTRFHLASIGEGPESFKLNSMDSPCSA